ncbi:hypothetical protein [Streptomyces sp. NPDC048577]|uniref:hypothetical protein n=1 Tax=Streptomyces sp. NPDC048577 TaxID=3157209 RepID=UPI00343736B2
MELQHALKELPDEVRDPPYVVPTYGVPFTVVPGFFTGWVSRFTGDATDMFPSPHAERGGGHDHRVPERPAGDRDALVEASSDALGSAVTVEDGARVWETLTGLLDLETESFSMHMR